MCLEINCVVQSTIVISKQDIKYTYKCRDVSMSETNNKCIPFRDYIIIMYIFRADFALKPSGFPIDYRLPI